MVESSTENNFEYEVFNSFDDIRNTLEGNLRVDEEDSFVDIHSDNIDYHMKFLAFKYGEDFNPKWKEIEETNTDWYMIDPLWISLLQGCDKFKFKKQLDQILKKVVRETEPENREKGIFSILRPEGDKFGILFIFHLMEEPE